MGKIIFSKPTIFFFSERKSSFLNTFLIFPLSEESLEFLTHENMIIPNIQPGRSYKVKVAAKSEGGMVGSWSESGNFVNL
jgi:hypothetical protein